MLPTSRLLLNCVATISSALFVAVSVVLAKAPPQPGDNAGRLKARPASSLGTFKGQTVFSRILDKAKKEHWRDLATGALMGKIAQEFIGTPYVAGTLDRDSTREICTVDLTGLDCVTFFETTLNLARIIKDGGDSTTDLLHAVTNSRYRGGKIDDYTSRLHYTSDWLYDNEQKGVIRILSDLPGAEPFKQKVNFMSTHPGSYKALVAHPELVDKLKTQESAINSRELKYIPLNKIAAIEPLLQTGDIVCVCTNLAGLDIVHTGLVIRDARGVVHFMDATSKKSKMQVVIEPGPLSQALKWSNTLTGAIFARPL